MAEQQHVVEIVRLYVGRGLRTEPFGETDEKLELSVDLYDLGTDYSADWVAWAGGTGGGGSNPATDTLVWMPLVDSDGTCVLDDTGVIPTLIPIA